MVDAVLILQNFFVAYLEEQDMWGVFSAFDIPVRPRIECYTMEQAIESCKIEEAAWQERLKRS